jgi:hypothetical protein
MLDDYVNMMMVVKKRNTQVLILSNLEAEYINPQKHQNLNDKKREKKQEPGARRSTARIRNVFGGEKNEGFGLSGSQDFK